ncbi:MAG: response regulator [Caldilineaceae bacterium]
MSKLFGAPTQVALNFVRNPRPLVALLVAAIFVEAGHLWTYSSAPNLTTFWVVVMSATMGGSALALLLLYRKRPIAALVVFLVVFNVSTTYHPLLTARSLFEVITGLAFALFLVRLAFGLSGFLLAFAANAVMLAVLWVGKQSGLLLFPLVLDSFQNSVHNGLWIAYAALMLYVLYAAISKEINNHLHIHQQLKHNAMIVQNVSDAIVSCSLPDFMIINWNRAAEEIYGWPAAEVMGRTSREIFKTHITLEEHANILGHVAQHGRWMGELEETHKSGHSVFVRVSFSQLKDEKGQPIALVGVSQDITLQKQTEQALARREAILEVVHFAAERFLKAHDWRDHVDELLHRLGLATEAVRVCLFEDRVESNDVRWTRETYTWQRNVEHPELNPGEINFDAMGLPHWRQIYETGQPISVQMATALPAERNYMEMAGVSCKLGVPIFVDQKLYGSLCLGQSEDLSAWQPVEMEALSIAANILGAAIERQEALRLLLQKQKLEEIGLLAGGIAHDFNNLLTGVLSQNSLVERRLEPDHKALKHVHKVRTAAQRAADLTQKLLAYAGKGHFVFEEVDLNLVVKETVDLIDASLREQQILELRLAPHLARLWADSSQLQQVVLNLLVNACEASQKAQPDRASAGGYYTHRQRAAVVVETSMRTIEANTLDELDEFMGAEQWKPGPYVGLKIRDHGVGMDAATITQIFTPFFSTKGSGRGLGLAACLGIVRALGGGIRVESQIGIGSTFEVLVPCLDHNAMDWSKYQMFSNAQGPLAIASKRSDTIRTEPVSNMFPTDQHRVLVIDDEPSIREAMTDILSLCNIEVLTAGNGPSGIELFQQHRSHIGCVIVDLEMPHMNGIEVLNQLYVLDPTATILLSSGYTAEEISSRLDGRKPAAFLQKPYDVDALMAVVQEFMPMGAKTFRSNGSLHM